MIRFENGNGSCMSAYAPEWQQAIIERVNEEYQDQAIAASNQFVELVNEAFAKAAEGYAGTAIAGAFNKVNRYCYIKDIDGDGAKYDAEIDLLLHTVSFQEVE